MLIGGLPPGKLPRKISPDYRGDAMVASFIIILIRFFKL